jgi:hypothetical protein
MQDDDHLETEEILLLIESLDALIPGREGSTTWLHASEEDQVRWGPYRRLRGKLKKAIHMSYFDSAYGWLDAELRQERIALTDRLHTRLAEMLKDPKATRRTIREGFVASIRELRESRQSPPRPLS